MQCRAATLWQPYCFFGESFAIFASINQYTMKKLLPLLLLLGSLMSLKAQWVDDPENNTFVANCSGDDSELYTSTVPPIGIYIIQGLTEDGRLVCEKIHSYFTSRTNRTQ